MPLTALRHIAFVLALLCTQLPLSPIGASGAEAGAKRVTLALGQPALIEAMGAAACFSLGEIDTRRQSDVALEAVDRFGTTLDAFASGHQWMGLEPATDPGDLARIAEAQSDWTGYAPAFEQVLAGDRHGVVISQLLRGIVPTSERALGLAEHFVSGSDAGAIDPAVLPALRLAARQQLLTQRALRQVCLVHIGLAGEEMRAALKGTLAEIARNAEQLAAGSGDVPAPPDARIARNLRTAGLFWSKVVPTLDAVANGQGTTDAAIAKALKMNKSVQKQLVQAVDGYAAARS